MLALTRSPSVLNSDFVFQIKYREAGVHSKAPISSIVSSDNGERTLESEMKNYLPTHKVFWKADILPEISCIHCVFLDCMYL